ncbi:S1C family serine protease [Hymenobacter sp. CRA2]|uniref:S1C family serine protease n=1 Tax=Hymenobacter sp. CRA2 TaxID=1955620 RepID=UPI00098FC002|nr:trypsin-like peptidase domain-containing protein [Hymenobacter sp. CRA2]OON68502.1 hypothetical protein B0919_12715 [Hymenobacter sp. CRA2]
MKKLFTPAVGSLLISSMLLQSCATIISTPKQTVHITGAPAGTVVYVNSTPAKNSNTTPPRVRLSRKKTSEITLKAEGYKDHTEILYPDKTNPLAILDLIASIPTLLIPYLVDMGTGAVYRLNKSEVNAPMIKLPNKIDGSLPVACSGVTVRFKGGDKLGNFYVKNSPEEILYYGKSLDTDANHLKENVNSALKEAGFSVPDTEAKSLFSAGTSAKYTVVGELQNIRYDVVATHRYEAYAKYFTRCETTVNWKLLNRKKEVVFEQKTTGNADKFEKGGSAAFEDSFENAFYAFLYNKKPYELLSKSAPKTTVDTEEEKEISLARPVTSTQESNDISRAAKGVVTVETTDGHGSGCILSADGYIVTNFHVVDGANEVRVVLQSGDSLKADIVRVNETMDLALLKVKAGKPLQPLRLVEEGGVDLGTDVFAIGTPADRDLGQTVTKGIISAQRKVEGRSFIQTDVSINPGNSGGALVNRTGNLLGVINAKLMGRGIEGLGFAIPAPQVLQALHLKYIN